MSKGGRYAQQKPGKNPKKKSKLVTVLTAILVILVLLVAGLIGFIVYQSTMDRMAGQIPTIPVTTAPVVETAAAQTQAVIEETTEAVTLPPETTEPQYTASGKDIVNILLVGQSYRPGEDSYLADTIILATVNKVTKKLTLTSFYRDTYVDLPDYGTHKCGWNKINTAYALGHSWGGAGGAMEMMSNTLKINFGVEVDHVVEIGLDAFMEIIILLDYVDIYLDEAEAKYLNNDKTWVTYEMTPNAVNTLDGMAALSYARMRHAEGDGSSDLKRTERQRKLLTAIFDKLKTRSFGSMQRMAETVLGWIVTDMTDEEITTCIWELVPLMKDLTIETMAMPQRYGDKELVSIVNGQEQKTWALQFDLKEQSQIMMEIAEADVLAAAATAPTTEPAQ